MELPMNLFPQDFDANLTGFGGDRLKNKAQHRSSIRNTPVILVYGNAAHSAHPKWGMETMKRFLTVCTRIEVLRQGADWRETRRGAPGHVAPISGNCTKPTIQARRIWSAPSLRTSSALINATR